MKKPYKICARCVMDTSANDISFDGYGVCNYCTDFIQRSSHIIHTDDAGKQHQLIEFVNQIKRDGRGKPYDCIIGVSGGVDSSWVLVRAVELGLRPLAVHMDNGWNSELAQNNIANLVQGLDVDLHTHVVDWQEYKALMQAFFDADVIDVELLYDNAMLAVNYEQAIKHNLKWMLSGSNQATEGMSMPVEWNWLKLDKKNIKSIAGKFGKVEIKTLPMMGVLQFIWRKYVRGVKWTSMLDLMDYNKFQAMRELQYRYEYKPYPYKHYESIFTRFYQGYILPKKFSIDKRRLHLSSLIVSGQISRDDAIKSINEIPYPSESDMNEDIAYFIKKMGWTLRDLEEYISRPEKSHLVYGSEKPIWDFTFEVYKKIKYGK